MTEIPRAALDYLTGQVNAISADARAKALKLLEGIEWASDNISECRAAALDALLAAVPAYADAAAQAGADFYDAVRTAVVGEALGAAAFSGFDPAAFDGAFRAFVQDMVDGEPVERFNENVVARIDRDIRRAPNMAVAENAVRDPLKPKYARVPSGGETCEFCIMLASRGAVYGTAEAASHAHPGCDCRAVPSFDGGYDIEGYDPDEYYELWKSGVAKDDKSISRRLNREWDRYKGAETEAAYFDTVGAYIRSFSVDGLVDCEYRSKPKAKELMTARSLAKNGHRVMFLRETEEGKNPDGLLDGEVCDFKRIESDNPNKIFQNIKRAGKQAEFFVIDLRISRISADDARRVSEQAVRSDETFAKKILLLFIDGEEELVKE